MYKKIEFTSIVNINWFLLSKMTSQAKILSEDYSESSGSNQKSQKSPKNILNSDSESSERDYVQNQRKPPSNKPSKQQNKSFNLSNISDKSEEEEFDNLDSKQTKKSSILEQLETGDDDDIENLLESSVVAENVSKKMQISMQDSDEYDETDLNNQINTDHQIPAQISSDYSDSEKDQMSTSKGKTSQAFPEEEEEQIDYKEAHNIFDKLNKLYKNGDEPVWDSLAKEPSFDFSSYVAEKMSELKKKNTGKILLDDIRNSK